MLVSDQSIPGKVQAGGAAVSAGSPDTLPLTPKLSFTDASYERDFGQYYHD